MSVVDVQPLGLCLDCNYALLAGLRENRCPECGRPFDPHDLESINRGKPLPHSTRWILGPLSWRSMTTVIVGMLVTLWFAHLPPTGRSTVPQTIIWVLVAAIWLLWPVLRWWLARRNGWRLSLLTLGRRSRLWVPAMVLAMLAAMHFKLPLRFSFALSKPKMTEIAQQMMENKKLSPRDQWIGTHKLTSIRRVPNGVRFTARRGDGYEAGFIYLPNSDQSRGPFSSYRPLGSGWWTWWEEVQ